MLPQDSPSLLGLSAKRHELLPLGRLTLPPLTATAATVSSCVRANFAVSPATAWAAALSARVAACTIVDSQVGCFSQLRSRDPHKDKEAVKAHGRVAAAGLGFTASAFLARPRRSGLFAVCPPAARPAGQRGASRQAHGRRRRRASLETPCAPQCRLSA